MGDYKNLSAREIDRFLKNNQYGILSFAGSRPYALLAAKSKTKQKQ